MTSLYKQTLFEAKDCEMCSTWEWTFINMDGSESDPHRDFIIHVLSILTM